MSTRGRREESDIDFLDVVLKSVAPDKGLYCPDYNVLGFTKGQLERLQGLSWVDLILRVQEKHIHPDLIRPQQLREVIKQSYESFADPAKPIQVVKLQGQSK